MTIRAENHLVNPRLISGLQRMVGSGEGAHLEFKQKAANPEKIVQEMIAFANSRGGNLLLGVDDAGRLSGLKFPDEESLAIRKTLARHCRPSLQFMEETIALSAKRFVIKFHIPRSEKRPHYFVHGTERLSFVRERDMCLKASHEMKEIIRRSKSPRGIRFSFGEHEKTLLAYLQRQAYITLGEYRKLAGISRHLASRKLVLLALAKVIKVTPTEKGDHFSLS